MVEGNEDACMYCLLQVVNVVQAKIHVQEDGTRSTNSHEVR